MENSIHGLLLQRLLKDCHSGTITPCFICHAKSRLQQRNPPNSCSTTRNIHTMDPSLTIQPDDTDPRYAPTTGLCQSTKTRPRRTCHVDGTGHDSRLSRSGGAGAMPNMPNTQTPMQKIRNIKLMSTCHYHPLPISVGDNVVPLVGRSGNMMDG